MGRKIAFQGPLHREGWCRVEQESAFRVRAVKVAVIQFPENWLPQSWDDSPPNGTVLSITAAPSRFYAEGMIYSFNAKRIERPADQNDRRWAVLLHPRSELLPGHHCHRRLPVFDGG